MSIVFWSAMCVYTSLCCFQSDHSSKPWLIKHTTFTVSLNFRERNIFTMTKRKNTLKITRPSVFIHMLFLKNQNSVELILKQKSFYLCQNGWWRSFYCKIQETLRWDQQLLLLLTWTNLLFSILIFTFCTHIILTLMLFPFSFFFLYSA